MLKKASKWLLIPTLIIGGLTACGYNDGARTNVYDGNRTDNADGVRPFATDNYTYDNRTWPNNNFANNYATRPYAFDQNQRVAKRVANLASNVPGVTRATAIVHGNDIVIGIDGTNQNSRALEQKVYRVVRNREPGYNVHVTADRNIHQRIQTIYTNMNTNNNTNPVTPGQPVRDLGTDVANIIRDIGRTVTAPFR